ncbi:hypothetical protein NDU88_001269 [Pleurodeles waltl]|uniref:Uncharacterized protein n=1 Tax=Pleurodeles waltl TaxID=8319 RepID=A0AAV7S724_PLEWA|nr:hypothetical protein NDU88_001269 [Pleurodeles waltl]
MTGGVGQQAQCFSPGPVSNPASVFAPWTQMALRHGRAPPSAVALCSAVAKLRGACASHRTVPLGKERGTGKGALIGTGYVDRSMFCFSFLQSRSSPV